MISKNCAFVCAGQGAQAVGMGRDLAEALPACRKLFDDANAILGFDLAGLCFNGPENELVKSNHCQPAIFTVSAACFMALADRLNQQKPPAIGWAGLSLGEWTALHLAGAIRFADCLKVLEARGRFMQEACEAEDGTMLSVIGLDQSRLNEIAAAAQVEVANYNSPEQTVLSGRRAGILRAEEQAKSAGAKRTVILNVAGAYHSSLMAPAAEKLERLLAEIPLQSPQVPVLSNVTGMPHGGPDEIRRLMVRQVVSPVQWINCVKWLEHAGANAYVELGPGRVLSGLIKRIAERPTLFNVADLASAAATAKGLDPDAK